ncbi:hypothetical protein BC938DRAFT_474239 [Jimgerdemannia flammicorona]|uniref:Uncharacterized protein n=1 Tax=Jimgerdemannia flammicorona TaxID=994334 RepID=A0A433Q2M9_9FUNG|nr:hypothetical protein BC938DRAFT_474239 [Jimgerdemannia flammicorona]
MEDLLAALIKERDEYAKSFDNGTVTATAHQDPAHTGLEQFEEHDGVGGRPAGGRGMGVGMELKGTKSEKHVAMES